MKLECYAVYLEEHKAEIEAGKPFMVEVIDRDIFEKKVVKAIVAKTCEALPDGDNLWIRDEKTELSPTPWKIKILEETSDLFARKRSHGPQFE